MSVVEQDVTIAGIGMHSFGRFPGTTGRVMGAVAARRALDDAGVAWDAIDIAYGGSYSSGDADSLVSDLGLTGTPFINVYNGCGTGGSALVSARNALLAGQADLALVVGFDKHPPGAFNEDPANLGLGRWYGESGFMVTTQFFAMKIARYLHEHDLDPGLLPLVAAKAFRNGSLNPDAWRRVPVSAQEIQDSKMLNHPLTKLMFCSPGEGAVALVLAGPRTHRTGRRRTVRLRAAEFRSRKHGSFEVYSPSVARDREDAPTVQAAAAAFSAAGISPDEVEVAQIQDTDAGAELIHLAETGLCAHGEQDQLIRSGACEIGGRIPVNTDGGVLANGEPIGATGLRQVYENVLQLRGDAGNRQVPGDPQVGFTQVYGAPGISACTVLVR